jgi:DNA-binding response OmpR family regulator
MDPGMAGMDGFKLAREVCGRLARRPLLVAITGHTTLARRSQNEGFDDHFPKPFHPAAFAALRADHAAKLGDGSGPASPADPSGLTTWRGVFVDLLSRARRELSPRFFPAPRNRPAAGANDSTGS